MEYASPTSVARSRVTVYAPDAEGDAVPIRSLWGSRTGLNWISGIAVDRKGRLYVGGYYLGRIRVFAPGGDGNVPPLRIIGGRPIRARALEASALAIGRDGRVYAMTRTNQQTVAVLAPGARESTPAERIIQGPNTGLSVPSAIALDRRGRIAIFNIGDGGSITIYDARASGDARPVQTIVGPATGVGPVPQPRPPKPPALPPSVVIFPTGAAGDIPPIRTIAGEKTMLVLPVSLALSSDTTLYVLSCRGRVTGYSSKADGNVVPSRLPTGKGLAEFMAYGLVVAGLDTVYVSKNWLGHGHGGGLIDVYVENYPIRQKRLEGFRFGTTGFIRNTAGLLYRGKDGGFEVIDPTMTEEMGRENFERRPREMVPRPNEGQGETELYWPKDFAADSHGRLLVPNADDAVRVYNADTTRDLRPLRTLSGRHTGLDAPMAAAIGPGDTLFVANRGPARGPSITVYRPNAAGDEAPVRRIAGSRTGLEALRALVVDAAGKVYVLNNPEGEEGCMPRFMTVSPLPGPPM